MQLISNDKLPEFGIFVGFWNKLHGSEFSVKEAKQHPILTEAFVEISRAIKEVDTGKGGRKSTKRQSMDSLKTSEIDQKILEFIKKNPNVSRSLISSLGGFRIQTTAGAVNRLLKAGKVGVSGTMVDAETKKTVETLVPV